MTKIISFGLLWEGRSKL